MSNIPGRARVSIWQPLRRSKRRTRRRPPAMLFLKIGKASERRFEKALKPLGLTPRHLGVLFEVRLARPARRALIDTIGVDPSKLVGLLNDLEAEGLIVRKRDPEDRRRHMVEDSAQGQRPARETEQVGHDGRGGALAGLGADRWKLLALLAQVADSSGIFEGCVERLRCASWIAAGDVRVPPRDGRGGMMKRGVMIVAGCVLLLAAAGCGSSSSSSSGAPRPRRAAGRRAEDDRRRQGQRPRHQGGRGQRQDRGRAGRLLLRADRARGKPGQKVKLELKNEGETLHTFTIDSQRDDKEIGAGQEAEVR